MLEVRNPEQASEILHNDMSVNMALPCRISVYEDASQTKIGMIPPTDILALISSSRKLRTAAEEVEKVVTEIIDESI